MLWNRVFLSLKTKNQRSLKKIFQKTMIWISFSSNILIIITAYILLKLKRDQIEFSSFIFFIALTGLSSGVAAFGHLPILNESWTNSLIFISRILSLISIYFFTDGSLAFASFKTNKIIRITNLILLITMVVVLFWNNVFLPVMIYGIVGFMGISLSAYLSNLEESKKGRYIVMRGIGMLSLSALVFALFKDSYHFLAINISHILVSYSLLLFSMGFVELNKYQ